MDRVMQKWDNLVAQLAPLLGLKAPSADLHAIGLYIAVPACLVLAYILLRALLGGLARGGARGKSILLVGPCGSGKTQLVRLVYAIACCSHAMLHLI
jgi:ABC-type protease/lipase transport system fused ATPase/permease subunit